MVTTTIKVSTETRDALRIRGHKGDTYDKIIQELIEEKMKEEVEKP